MVVIYRLVIRDFKDRKFTVCVFLSENSIERILSNEANNSADTLRSGSELLVDGKI